MLDDQGRRKKAMRIFTFGLKCYFIFWVRDMAQVISKPIFQQLALDMDFYLFFFTPPPASSHFK